MPAVWQEAGEAVTDFLTGSVHDRDGSTWSSRRVDPRQAGVDAAENKHPVAVPRTARRIRPSRVTQGLRWTSGQIHRVEFRALGGVRDEPAVGRPEELRRGLRRLSTRKRPDFQ